MMNEQRDSLRVILLAAGFLLVAGLTASAAAEEPQVPSDVRIMQNIIRAAMEDVEAPELPENVKTWQMETSGQRVYVSRESDQAYTYALRTLTEHRLSSRDVSGFYMEGYGYLFNIDVGTLGGGFAFATGDELFQVYNMAGRLMSSDVRGRTEQTEEQQAEQEKVAQEQQGRKEREAALQEWRTRYQERITEALRQVLATYGSTLKRASEDEQVTFIVDFGSGGAGEKVSLSVRKGEIAPPDQAERTLRAIRTGRTSAGSEKLQRQVRIMGEIIDAALRPDDEAAYGVVAAGGSWFGGEADPVYIQGYGVIFRKNALMRTVTLSFVENPLPGAAPDSAARVKADVRATQVGQEFRARLTEQREESKEKYREHLDELKRKTAGLLVDYGPTVTELAPDEWVGIYFSVGSASSVLAGGVENFLVQARMRDIREAAGRGEGGVDWLLQRLVTNEAPIEE